MIATQAEAERIAQEKADAEAKEKEEADRIAAEKAEAERLLKEQAEAEAKKSDEADRLAAEAAKAKASSDEAAKEAEEKAEEAEEAVERETEGGEGVLPTARNIGLGAVEQLGGVQRSVQHRARSPQPPTSPYAGAEAYTLAYSGAPPSQILAGAPPPLPPPVRNPTGPTSARENALEARELALEERLRYVEAMLAAKTRMEGSVSRGAALRGNQSVS